MNNLFPYYQTGEEEIMPGPTYTINHSDFR